MKKTGPPLNTQQQPHVYQIGDTVKLKTGGPLMLVKEVFPDVSGQKLLCLWFQESKLQSDMFSSELVKLMAAVQTGPFSFGPDIEVK